MPQYTQSRQNQVKIISLLIFILLLVAAFFWYRAEVSPDAATRAEASESAMFMGLRKVSATEVHRLWPEAKGQPLLVEFNSKYCLDCKKMAPIIKQAITSYPQVQLKAFEIMEDKKANPAVFNAFKPVTVPVLVFINPDGEIQNVLYNYQTGKTISQNLQAILPASTQP